MQNKRKNKFFSETSTLALLLCSGLAAAPLMAEGLRAPAEYAVNAPTAYVQEMASLSSKTNKKFELLPEEKMLLTLKKMIGDMPVVPNTAHNIANLAVVNQERGVSYFKPIDPSEQELKAFSAVVEEARKEMVMASAAKAFGKIAPAGGTDELELEFIDEDDFTEELVFEDDELELDLPDDDALMESIESILSEEVIEFEEDISVEVVEVLPPAVNVVPPVVAAVPMPIAIEPEIVELAEEEEDLDSLAKQLDEVQAIDFVEVKPTSIPKRKIQVKVVDSRTIADFDLWEVKSSMFAPRRTVADKRDAELQALVERLAAIVEASQKRALEQPAEVAAVQPKAKAIATIDTIPLAEIISVTEIAEPAPRVKAPARKVQVAAARKPIKSRTSSVVTKRVRNYLDRIPADGFTTVDDRNLIKDDVSISRGTVRNPFAAADKKVEDPNLRKDVGLEISVTSQDTTVYDALTLAYQALIDGEFETSVANYSKVLAKDANNIDAKFGIATAFHGLGSFEQARNAYLDVLDINPRHEFALNNLMVLLSELSPSEGMAELKDLQKLNPGYAAVPAQIGMLYMQNREFVKAARSLKLAVEIDPKNLDYRYNLAMLFEYLGGYDVSSNMYKVILNEGLKGAILPVERKEIVNRIEQLAVRQIESK